MYTDIFVNRIAKIIDIQTNPSGRQVGRWQVDSKTENKDAITITVKKYDNNQITKRFDLSRVGVIPKVKFCQRLCLSLSLQ